MHPSPHAGLLTAQVALLAIYLSSIIVRTLLRGFTVTGFETVQCAVAFAIGVGGGLQLTNDDARVAPALAVLALGCARRLLPRILPDARPRWRARPQLLHLFDLRASC